MNQTNLQAVLADLKPMKPERQLRMDGPPDDSLRTILRDFEDMLNWEPPKNTLFLTKNFLMGIMLEFANLPIDKNTIDNFILCSSAYETDKNVNKQSFSYTTGVFLSALVQLAYLQGANNFLLDLTHLENKLDCVCAHLAGSENNRLAVTIRGDVGRECGGDVEYCTFKIEGSTDYTCAIGAKFSDFYITGNTGNMFGAMAKHTNLELVGDSNNCAEGIKDSVVKIKGNVTSCLGDMAERSKITIDGDVGLRCGFMAKDCIFVLLGDIGTKPLTEDKNELAAEYILQYQQGLGAERTIFRAKLQDALDKLLKNRSEGCTYKLITN